MISSTSDTGTSVEHVFAAQLAEIDEQARTGDEYTDPPSSVPLAACVPQPLGRFSTADGKGVVA